MVNEDIVTILRNAVNKGEPLQSAMQVLTNSGYDSQQVQEASTYVQGGAMQNLSPRPDENLIMAQNKSMFQNNRNMQQQNSQTQKPNHMQMQQNRMQNPATGNPMQLPQNNQQQIGNMQQKPINSNMQMQQIPIGQKDQFATQPLPSRELQQLTKPIQQQTMSLQNGQAPNQQLLQTPAMNQGNTQLNNQQQAPIKLKKKSHKKEIILLIILLFLIGVLVTTIMFRSSILNFLSG